MAAAGRGLPAPPSCCGGPRTVQRQPSLPALLPRQHTRPRQQPQQQLRCAALPPVLQPPQSRLLLSSPQPRLAVRSQRTSIVSSSSSSRQQRTTVVAAAGRRRQASAAQPPADDEPELDMDDVMFGGDDGGGDEDDAELGLDGDEAAAPEAPDDEDEDEEFDEYEFGDEDEAAEDAEAAGEGGWDNALANFDPAQDAVAAPAPPTEEERQHAAALAMVRYDAEVSDATLEVSDAPPPEPGRPKTFDEMTQALTAEDRQALASNRQGYAVFPMDGLDLLVSETADGRLALADCFIQDTEEELFSRPIVDDGVPAEPALYQLLPWEVTHTGDFFKRIEPKTTLLRMYFVRVSSIEPHEADFDAVFSFDSSSATMTRHDVITLGADLREPVLRIREDGVFVEDAACLPGVAFVAEGFAGHPSEPYTNPDKEYNIRDYVKMGLWPEPGLEAGQTGAPSGKLPEELDADMAPGIEERLEELELMEELDDMPDVPAVDMV